MGCARNGGVFPSDNLWPGNNGDDWATEKHPEEEDSHTGQYEGIFSTEIFPVRLHESIHQHYAGYSSYKATRWESSLSLENGEPNGYAPLELSSPNSIKPLSPITQIYGWEL